LIREWKQPGWNGNSPAGAARRLGAGRASVSKRLKALKIGATRDVPLRSAAKLVDRGMIAMAQLQKASSVRRFARPGATL
jgi:hypothetical protein